MKTFAAVLVGLSVGLVAQLAVPSTQFHQTISHQAQVVEHGGGCRKSSPPGMCCHMDNGTGVVHCH